MIRNATIPDCEPIAGVLWTSWHRLKARQIATPLHAYASVEVLAEEIRGDLGRWVVCDSSDSHEMGFFALRGIGADRAYKRWRFPERAVRIDHFASLLGGLVLLRQFQLLISHLHGQSILVCFASSLRDAYWAAINAGLRQSIGDIEPRTDANERE
jgi:hypothetical protein